MGVHNSQKKILDNHIVLRYKVNKILCIFIVTILILTAISSSISAKEISDISQEKNQVDNKENQKSQYCELLKEFARERRELIPLHIVTNHNGKEKTTKMRLFLPTTIDVDDDGDKDIRVWTLRFPGIDLQPLALCMKTTLIIRRLAGMDDIKDDHFEIYLENFPRVVSRLSSGAIDRVRIGYQSIEGQEIPDICKIIYKYIPHAIHLRHKPKHKITIDPGSIKGNYDLNLIFSTADISNGVVLSQNIIRTEFTPAVSTETSISRNFLSRGFSYKLKSSSESKVKIYYTTQELHNSSGVGVLIDKLSSFEFDLVLTPLNKRKSKIEFTRVSTNPVDVTLFVENANDLYFYVKNIPKHILLTWIPNGQGWMEFTTFDTPINEIGFTNNLESPTWKLYFADLPSEGKLTWNISEDSKASKGSMNVYGFDNGFSVHLNATVVNELYIGGYTKILADLENEDKIDLSFSWDLNERFIRLDRSATEIDLDLAVFGQNDNLFSTSCILDNLENEPFTLYYDNLNTIDLNVSIVGKSFVIRNLVIFAYLVNIGEFTIKMAHVVKVKTGFVNVSLYVKDDEEYNIIVNCTLIVTGGVEIYDLEICFNGIWFNESKIIVDEDEVLYFQFGGKLNVNIDIAPDLSWGLIEIQGSAYLKLDMPISWNGTYGEIKGEIYFSTNGDTFSIYWSTVKNIRQFSVNGNAVTKLKDFKFWFGNLINMSIPNLTGNILIENASKERGFFKFEFEGEEVYLHLNSMFLSTQAGDITLNLSYEGQIDTAGEPVTIIVGWDEESVTDFNFTTYKGTTLEIIDFDMELRRNNKFYSVRNMSTHLSGEINLEMTNVKFVATLIDLDAYLHIDNYYSTELDLGEIEITALTIGRGIISIDYLGNYTYFNPPFPDKLVRHNLTIDISTTDIMNLNLYIEHYLDYDTISIKNLNVTEGSTKINTSLSVLIEKFYVVYLDVHFDNSPGMVMTFEEILFDLVLLLLGNVYNISPIPTKIYDARLTEGIFEFHARFYKVAMVEIINSTAINSIGITIGRTRKMDPHDFLFNIYLNDPIEYFYFDVDFDVIEKIILDTHNTTTKVNFTLLMPSETLNMSHNIGFRFDNVTFQADYFVIYLPNIFYLPEVFTLADVTIQGYLNVLGKDGKIIMLINDTWYRLDTLGFIADMTVFPGYFKLDVEGEMILDNILPIDEQSKVIISGRFIANNSEIEIWWNKTSDYLKLRYNGSVLIENLTLKIDINSSNYEQFYFELKGNFSFLISNDAFISLRGTEARTIFEINMSEWRININDFNAVIISNHTKLFESSIKSLNATGPASFAINSNGEYAFSIEGYLELFETKDFYIFLMNSTGAPITLALDSAHFRGEFSIENMPDNENTFDYIGIKINHIFGEIKLDNIQTSLDTLRNLNYFYINASGDIEIESWKELDDEDWFSYIKVKNGIDVSKVAIGFDDNSSIGLDQLLVGHIGHIGPGFLTTSTDLGDGDGYIYLDSSNITFTNLMIIYVKANSSDKGIRFSTKTGHLNANGFLLQWDNLIYQPPIVIPYNWQREGDIRTGKIDIDIFKDGYFWNNFTLPPYADHGGIYNVKVLDEVYFNGTGSYDPDGDIIQYDWFYKGSWHNDIGSTPGPIVYLLPIIRPIGLRVHDSDGNIDEAWTYIDVNLV